jgi:5-methylcytosine-specific restriction endonuclease McrA
VVLTTAHRDHMPEHCAETNLFAACQRCHLAYDSGHHRETRNRTRHALATAGMEPLPGPWPEENISP